MDYCPLFLEKEKRNHFSNKGLTLIELLIVLAVISVIATFTLVALNPITQMQKGRDARRKSDLQKLKNSFEDYYNDHKSYPATLVCGDTALAPYINKVPCDPQDNSSYFYSTDGATYYRVYTTLEYLKDESIAKAGCQNGCVPTQACAYNYGVTSGNVGLEPCP
ncbi:MAG: prepilin-type N-terminal cleavage/methylation domain-containing protein [bacterium]|nr:prepilin-type N-terminal cleavage/methylation domain-containing protein [bacterium]